MIFPAFDEGFISYLGPETLAVVGSVDGGCHGHGDVGSPFAEGPAASFQSHPASMGFDCGFRPMRLLRERVVRDAEKTQKPQ